MARDTKPGKLGAQRQQLLARARAHFGQRRSRADRAAELLLAAGTLLLLCGLFMAWQTWLAWRQSSAVAQLQAASVRVAHSIANDIAADRRELELTFKTSAWRDMLAGHDDEATRAALATQLQSQLVHATAVHVYSAQLSEVLRGNIAHVGYARAAQLVASMSSTQISAAQSPAPDIVSFVVPIIDAHGNVRAFATVDYPATPLRDTVSAAEIGPGRLELRQASRAGNTLLFAEGNAPPASADDKGTPVAGSLYRVVTSPPRYWLPVTTSWIAAAVLTVLALVLGSAALWWRLRVRLGGAAPAAEKPFSEIIANLPAEPQPAPQAVAAEAQSPAPAGGDDAPPDASIFRAYDIRGVVGSTLSAGVARQLGRAIGSAVRDKGLHEIVVGRDGRKSGPMLTDALIEGLRAAGVNVIDLGAVPTPVSYFAAFQLNTGSCISVTGSHNPPDYNGFKVVIDGETLAEDAIQDLYRRIVDRRFTDGEGSLRQYDITGEYIERIASDIQTGRSLKVVVDCGNGIAGNTAPGVVHAIGCEPTPLYCEVDGDFPNHHPDPSDPKNLADLILTVKNTDADLGLAFDGDGDRLGVVTKAGQIIYPDRVLMLFAEDVLTRNPGTTIIYDVKCTGHLQPLILKAGGSPLMWKTGHSLIKAKMRETEAELAGEMSGHFFFRERWYGFDDGVYAAARLLEILADDPEGRTPDEIFAALPNDVATPELHVDMAEGDTHPFIARFRERAQFEGARLSTIDGVRADWPDGFGLVRASNTTPVLVLRFAGDTADALKRVEDAFRTQLLACDPDLKLPF